MSLLDWKVRTRESVRDALVSLLIAEKGLCADVSAAACKERAREFMRDCLGDDWYPGKVLGPEMDDYVGVKFMAHVYRVTGNKHWKSQSFVARAHRRDGYDVK